MAKKKDKKKDRKEARKKALKKLFNNKYFVKNIAILMKMEDYPNKEVKQAFKKLLKKQWEEVEISMTAWSSNGKKSSSSKTAWNWDEGDDEDVFSKSRIDSSDKRKVVRRDVNMDTIDIISSIFD